MRQEHLIAARLFHHLYGHIDHSQRVIFCLDGMAAKRGVNQDILEDPNIPDFHWTFNGGAVAFSAEVKIVDSQNRVRFCGDGQPRSWGTGGTAAVKPHLWIGANEDMNKYFIWKHKKFEENLSFFAESEWTDAGNKRVLNIQIPDDHLCFNEPAEASVEIIRWARQVEGMYP